MTELEKLDAGLEFCFADPEVEARKGNAVTLCRELNSIPHTDRNKQREVITMLFGSAGKILRFCPVFNVITERISMWEKTFWPTTT